MFDTSLYDEILYDESVKILFKISLPKGRTWIFTREKQAGLLTDEVGSGLLTMKKQIGLATEEKGVSLLTKTKPSNI